MLTHEGSKVQRSLFLPVHSLDIGPFQKEECEHLKMAIVGSMVESRLPSTITDVQVTKMGNQNLCSGSQCMQMGEIYMYELMCVCVGFNTLHMYVYVYSVHVHVHNIPVIIQNFGKGHLHEPILHVQ